MYQLSPCRGHRVLGGISILDFLEIKDHDVKPAILQHYGRKSTPRVDLHRIVTLLLSTLFGDGGQCRRCVWVPSPQEEGS